MKVALIKRDESGESLRKAIELCGGFEQLRSGGKVLIKPNLCLGSHKDSFPPFGRVTTATIIEELAVLLHENGCSDITIGEGCVISKELNSTVKQALKWSGIYRVARSHDLKLSDFDKGSYEKVKLNGHSFDICKEALEADFLINVPVLKTHCATKVSLGMKNLKGCLKHSSKKLFHRFGLEEQIVALNRLISPQLTIIDGTYTLERGPTSGQAHREDIMIASSDALAADMVGTAVLGKEPSCIIHLKEYARLADRSLELESLEILGERIEDVARDLPYQLDEEFLLEKCGTRVTFADPPATVCCGCVWFTIPQVFLVKDNPGICLENIEVCVGKGALAHPESDTVILHGDCAINSNKGFKGAIEVKGCPPKVSTYLPLLYKTALDKKQANIQISKRVIKAIGTKMNIYHEDLGAWKDHRSPEFDINHFA